MTLVEQLEADRKKNVTQTRAEYRKIIERDCSGTSQPGDATMLGEILRELGKSESDFAKDRAAYNNYLRAKLSAEDFESKNTPAEVQRDTQAAYERMAEAQKQLAAAQRAYEQSCGDYNGQCGRQRMRELCSEQVSRAKESCGTLLDS